MLIKNNPEKDNIAEDHQKIIDFINDNEFFWLEDMRIYLGICNTEPTRDNTIYSRMTKVIDLLKLSRVISCCEVKGSRRQYMVNDPKKKITFLDIDNGWVEYYKRRKEKK